MGGRSCRCCSTGRPRAWHDLTKPQFDLFGSDGGDTAGRARARVAPAPPAPVHVQLSGSLPASLRLGTSSWSFPGWAGIVYEGEHSERALARDGLRAYALHPLLRAVGIDRSYYAPLDAAAYAAYAADVPDDFRFLVKAERLLTLPDIEDGRGGMLQNPRFLDPDYARQYVVEPVSQGLGSRAGPILFQFSPMHPRRVGGPVAFAAHLQEFLDALPRGPLYAVELRTPELFTAEYAAALKSAGAVHGYVVHGSMTPLDQQLALLPPGSQRALVVRWMLHARHGYNEARAVYAPFDSIVDVDDESRSAIVKAALAALDEKKEAYVIVNNKAEGSSPLSVFALAELIKRASA